MKYIPELVPQRKVIPQVRDATPVQCLAVVHTFPSKHAAARYFGVDRAAIQHAVERGQQCCGVWWRYTDMPADCQPLVDPKRRAVVRDDGRRFESLFAAIRDAMGADTPYAVLKRECNKLGRAIKSRSLYRGRVYRDLLVSDVAPHPDETDGVEDMMRRLLIPAASHSQVFPAVNQNENERRFRMNSLTKRAIKEGGPGGAENTSPALNTTDLQRRPIMSARKRTAPGSRRPFQTGHG